MRRVTARAPRKVRSSEGYGLSNGFVVGDGPFDPRMAPEENEAFLRDVGGATCLESWKIELVLVL